MLARAAGDRNINGALQDCAASRRDMAEQTPQFSLSRTPAEIRYALILTLIMTAGGLLVLGSIPLSLFDKASALVSFSLLLLPYMLFASRHFLEWLRARTEKSLFI